MTGENPPSGIALFDLDGTLIAWDCQLLFRHHVVTREPWRRVFLPVFLGMLPLYPILETDGMKRVFLSYLWKMPDDRLAAYAKEFAESVMPIIYPEIREKLDRHRQAGHLTILTSASPEFYVSEIGKRLGFDLIHGTRAEMGPLFPDLVNNKGPEKVVRLREILPASYFNADGTLPECHGYTDSTADLPMLALCQSATLVNPKPELVAIGEKHGWEIKRPARPWKSKAGFVARSLKLLLGIGGDPGGLRE